MTRQSLLEALEKNRRTALDARDRFYREAAAGEVPRDLRAELAASVMQLRDAVREVQPLDQRDELPDVSNVREVVFNNDLDGSDLDASEAVQLIDELDALARNHGLGGAE